MVNILIVDKNLGFVRIERVEMINQENAHISIDNKKEEAKKDNKEIIDLFCKLSRPKNMDIKDIILWKKMSYVLKTRVGKLGYVNAFSFLQRSEFYDDYKKYFTLSFKNLKDFYNSRKVLGKSGTVFSVPIYLFESCDMMSFMKYCDNTYLEMINRKLLENK